MIILKQSKQLGLQIVMNVLRILIVVMIGISSVWADNASNKITTLGISNLQHPLDNVYASGQPTEELFSGIANAGVQVIVNLRPKSEQNWNEQAIVESFGMRYINLPIAGADGVTNENAKRLDMILAELDGKQVLVHCSSSNRFGALRALSSFQKNGGDVNAAIEDGNKWGLTKLESLVREKLSQ